jgi:hypothetical protein
MAYSSFATAKNGPTPSQGGENTMMTAIVWTHGEAIGAVGLIAIAIFCIGMWLEAKLELRARRRNGVHPMPLPQDRMVKILDVPFHDGEAEGWFGE